MSLTKQESAEKRRTKKRERNRQYNQKNAASNQSKRGIIDKEKIQIERDLVAVRRERRRKQQKLRRLMKKKENETVEKKREYYKLYRRQSRKNAANRKRETDKETRPDQQSMHTPLRPVLSRVQKCRAIKKLKRTLPTTPLKRSETVLSYINSDSPTAKAVKKVVLNESPPLTNVIANAVVEDLKTVVSTLKVKRDRSSRAVMNVIAASASGENVRKRGVKRSLAKELGMPPRRISNAKRLRTDMNQTESGEFDLTPRSTRADAIQSDTKLLVYDYWLKYSHPTGNKNEIKRKRLSTNVYSSHMIHILEQSQTEIYLQFKRDHPDIKIGQRSFERLKPYYVQQASAKHRQTCCCRKHVDTRACFKVCMQYREKLNLNSEEYPTFKTLRDVVDVTLCKEPTKVCYDRNCKNCGVEGFKISPEEMNNDSTVTVNWNRYEYQIIKTKKNKEIRKLQLVKKTTTPKVMFEAMREYLVEFAAHQFRASWQNDQLKQLKENLAANDIICIHDFSENYAFKEATEVQSSYFSRAEATLHVTVLHRHLTKEEKEQSGETDSNKIITEHIHVISPDLEHDHHFTRGVQTAVKEHLTSLNFEISDCTMHEFTDGCACQYKSRNCFGFNARLVNELGFKGFTRNFFETSHAKGPQDAAGGVIKNAADAAITKNPNFIIQNAEQLHQWCISNMIYPKSSSGSLTRRVFVYIESINRNDQSNFHPIIGIRSLHQMQATAMSNKIITRYLSCYTCSECAEGYYSECRNDMYCGPAKPIAIAIKNTSNTNETPEPTIDATPTYSITDMIDGGVVVAVFTLDEEDDYYLMRCDSRVVSLTDDMTDSWGATYTKGERIVTGMYYKKAGRVADCTTYKIIKRRQAVIPSISARFILVESGDELRISDNTHFDIIAAMEEFENSFK